MGSAAFNLELVRRFQTGNPAVQAPKTGGNGSFWKALIIHRFWQMKANWSFDGGNSTLDT